MRNIFKAAIVAFGVTGALAAVPAGAQPYDPRYDGYDQGYGPDDADYDQDAVYCDPYYGCPDDYYDLPLYYGDVYYDGGWSTGPFFYRDYGGGRQFWIHGGWHGGNFRGGRFGPALGRDYFARHNFGGGWNRGGNFGGGYNRGGNFGGRDFNRSDNVGGPGYARRAYQPQQTVQPQPFSANHNWNRGSFGGGGWNRQGVQSFQSQTVQPQTFQGNGGGWRGRGFQAQAAQPQSVQPQAFQGGGGGWRGRSFQGQQPAAPVQQTAAPAQPRNNDGDGWHHRR